MHNRLLATHWTRRKRREFAAECRALGANPDEYWEDVTAPDPHGRADGGTDITAPEHPLYDFNEFVAHAARRGVGINETREAFHRFVYPDGKGGSKMPLPSWWLLWDAFVAIQDAKDERETRDDALGRGR